jgi:hypothetical protein
MSKPIFGFNTNTLLGVQVLSMSKRIMNEVMTTAEDLDIKIYYQDTDSIHIKQEDLPLLADKFKDKYNRELIGSDLGQFHSDFDSIASSEQIKEAASQGVKYQVWSKKLIALGKKSYLDILEDNLGNIGYHARMKGVPNQCLTIKCQELGITLEELFIVNTNEKWEQVFIDRNKKQNENMTVYKLLQLSNFGMYLKCNDKLIISHNENVNDIEDKMKMLFPKDAKQITDIDYLIKPSKLILQL